MRQHRGIREIFSRPGRLAVLGVLGMGLSLGSAGAQGGADGSNIARLSFVQGSVQLQAGGQDTDFQQAVLNMPVLAGSRVQTGGDGQAEIEFGDGSVARLTPNSGLEIDGLDANQAQLQQLSGLAYYEFNVGDGHPPFQLQFSGVDRQPTANSIVRVGMDAGWEAAVISGSVNVQGNGIPPAAVTENQSVRSSSDNNGAPYTVAQGVNGDSWDNWNQDRDQAIAQEASAQTPVREDSGNPQNENWNDLDADGNWYPVEGAGNVWVPAGVGPEWDPYGSGYWAYYPTFGYTWVSGYSWGWLPYHCGEWNYYPFGWGWAPGGGCGRTWSPVVIVRSYPHGWQMPRRPIPGPGVHPLPVQRLVPVDRGIAAKGPWGLPGPVPRPNHQLALNFKGETVAPIVRLQPPPQAATVVRGTSPGTRAVLNGSSPRPISTSTYLWGANPPRAVERPNAPAMRQPDIQRPVVSSPNMPRPYVGVPPPQNYNQRSTYVPREPATTPHYSAPPPQQHYSPPPSAPRSSSPSPRR